MRVALLLCALLAGCHNRVCLEAHAVPVPEHIYYIEIGTDLIPQVSEAHDKYICDQWAQ